MIFDLVKNTLQDASVPLVVIIDDELTSRVILERIILSIQSNISVKTFSDPVKAIDWLQDKSNRPDLILVDYMMSGMNGLEVVQRIKEACLCVGTPIVVVTCTEDKEIRYQALESGASDFINKPIDPYECRIRCRNMLYFRLQQKILVERSHTLEQQIALATEQISFREHETLHKLAKAGEYRDSDTGNHVLRMAKYAYFIAEQLNLSKDHCRVIELAAPMHDIGKIGIPDNILLKPGRLEMAEFEVMKTHAQIGYQILQGSPSKYLSLGAEIALCHHEKYNGGGYPNALKGEAIPLEARIVAVADVFDALTSERPYKEKWSNEKAIEYLIADKEKHFDPVCVDAFMEQFDKVSEVQNQLKDVFTE
jgi:two-component system response regulator RpfG